MQQDDQHYHRACASLRQSLAWYLPQLRSRPQLAAALQPAIQTLQQNLDKLDRCLVKIAVFGLVSRGKSAVLNALVGQPLFATGPTHGVTKMPKSLLWQPNHQVQVELIDTPGLDEVDGQERAALAVSIARQADLILFVVAGDITRTEYQALQELRSYYKPLLLVFNKIDLYPDTDRQEIYRQLVRWSLQTPANQIDIPQNLSGQDFGIDDVIMVAAAPAPLEFRHEGATITHGWYTPPPQIDQLKHKILQILNQSGKSLLALNALVQAQQAQQQIAAHLVNSTSQAAEELIWRYVKIKSLAIALNPLAFLDVLGGVVTDLALIRALAKLYGLPITNYQAARVWQQILRSGGSLVLVDLATNFLWSLGKGAALFGEGGWAVYGSGAIAQAGVAGYGAYLVGRAAQVYLEQGGSWGEWGASAVIQEILAQTDSSSILYRLQQEM